MTRCAARLLLLIALAVGPARADCFDWDDVPMLDQGTMAGVPTGPLRWRIGRNPAGGAHLATAVDVTWTGPDGIARRQALFEGIQDGQPRLRARQGGLSLRIDYCETGRDVCHAVTLTYGWDRTAQRFFGTNRAARESLAAACGSLPEPVPPAASEPAP